MQVLIIIVETTFFTVTLTVNMVLHAFSLILQCIANFLYEFAEKPCSRQISSVAIMNCLFCFFNAEVTEAFLFRLYVTLARVAARFRPRRDASFEVLLRLLLLW